CDRALAIRPDYAEALSNRGTVLLELNRFEEALASCDRALTVRPHDRNALNGLVASVQNMCDWTRTAKLADEVAAHITERKSAIMPFTLLGYCDDPSLHLQCAKNYIREQISVEPEPLWRQTVWSHDRIRIAYLSADFHGHATAYLTAELFERHDRSRFEVVGVSFGPDDGSRMRARLVRAFDQFHDVRSKSDLEIANLLNELQIDIAVDLKGHTKGSRPRIF